jgi:hypothetical protein
LHHRPTVFLLFQKICMKRDWTIYANQTWETICSRNFPFWAGGDLVELQRHNKRAADGHADCALVHASARQPDRNGWATGDFFCDSHGERTPYLPMAEE